LPVFSPFIGTFGYANQIANIANDQMAIGTFGYGKQMANIANGPTDRPRTRHAPPGMVRYADQIGQSFCLLDRFLQLAFC